LWSQNWLFLIVDINHVDAISRGRSRFEELNNLIVNVVLKTSHWINPNRAGCRFRFNFFDADEVVGKIGILDHWCLLKDLSLF